MKLKRRVLLPSMVCLFLAVATSIGWKTIHSTKPSRKENKEEIKSKSSHSILSNNFESAFKQIRHLAPTLDSTVFKQAYIGYLNLREQGKTNSPIITIADLSIHSSEPRLWIIDLAQDSVLLHTFVAHGRGSGLAEAKNFSNRVNSNQSSLGFYLTGETYQGKHGRSLRLDGLDRGYNTNARARGIVLHGAWYVGANILKGQDRMGVSQGCPAVAEILKDKVIDLIKDRSMLFIHGNSNSYHSALLNEETATQGLMAANTAAEQDIQDTMSLNEEGNSL